MDFNVNSVTGLPDSNLTNTATKYFQNLGVNPVILVILIIVIFVFYIIFSSLGKGIQNSSSGGQSSFRFLEIILWGLFITLVLLNGIAYFFNIDIITNIKDLFNKLPKIQIVSKKYLDESNNTPSQKPTNTPITVDPIGNSIIPEDKEAKEVFNIPENKYTYSDAKALCKAYGANLANYQQLEEAYEKGASWCNYGWSEDQMAYFPTNLKKWKKLQKIPGHENDCGRPGINGGFIDNPNVRFGANCYGFKPKITNTEEILMENSNLYPQTVNELEFDKKVQNYQNKLSEILVSPFNAKSWSVI